MAEDYYIQKTGYLQFDAKTIEQYIKDRLNADPDVKFTDHNFDGSYFSSLIEVLSYTFNVMMFYLNQTSTESKFTDAQIYENMNRMVKMVGYSPLGPQTSLTAFEAYTEISDTSLYVIPRYSYINAGGTSYSFNEDFVFSPASISTSSEGKVIYQGKFYEYPLYTASGIENEIIFLNPGDKITVDHFNIHVYVKSKDGKWQQWNRTDSLILKRASDRVFEVRYNENGNYEIKFGNGINGQILNYEDSVAVYYLQSGGKDKKLNIGDLKDVKYIKFASSQFSEGEGNILKYVWENAVSNIVRPDEISFDNNTTSTEFERPETVDEIRNMVPSTLKRPLTISKVEDFDRVVRAKFSNFISDVKTMDNFNFLKSYLRYFKELGETSGMDESRFIYNQVQFADACNFNNMYIFVKPKLFKNATTDFNRFLSPTTKRAISNYLLEYKIPTIEPIVMDPVYMAVSIGINIPSEELTLTDITNTKLKLIKDPLSLRDTNSIRGDVATIIQTYFSQDNIKFGSTINLPELAASILGVNGVVDFRVVRTDSDYYYEGLTFITWNPVYNEDIQLVLRTKTFEDFQVPYLQDRENIIDFIIIEDKY